MPGGSRSRSSSRSRSGSRRRSSSPGAGNRDRRSRSPVARRSRTPPRRRDSPLRRRDDRSPPRRRSRSRSRSRSPLRRRDSRSPRRRDRSPHSRRDRSPLRRRDSRSPVRRRSDSRSPRRGSPRRNDDEDPVAAYKRRLNISGAEAFARRAALSGGHNRGGDYGGRGGGGGGGGGGAPRTCYNCNEEGHISRDCPQPRRSNAGGGGGNRNRGPDPAPPAGSIHKGKVKRIEDYGCFVEVGDNGKWGLVHVTQMLDTTRGGPRVEAKDVVDLNDEVWVKVAEVEEETQKMSLTMKYVSQATGRDLDPENAEYEVEQQRRVGGTGRGRQDQKIDIADPLSKSGEFREDAWAKLQMRGKKRGAGEGESFEMVTEEAAGGAEAAVASIQSGERRSAMTRCRNSFRERWQKEKDELKMLKALLKEQKKDKKKKEKKEKKEKKGKKEKKSKGDKKSKKEKKKKASSSSDSDSH